jgi:molecular chaperone GrpE
MSKKNKKNIEKDTEKIVNKEENVEKNQENQEMQDTEIKEEQKDKEEQTTDNEPQEETNNDWEEKYNELNDRYLRLIAEYDNFRKRTLKEKMELVKNGGADVLKNILPVVDNFERALKAIEESDDIKAVKEGIELIYKNFMEFLQQRGVNEIEAVGMPLDTDLHEAVAQMPAANDEQKGKIIDVVEKGYKLNDRVLRFAKVVIAQ